MATPAQAETGTLPQQTKPVAGRVLSIDALRGFDMFWLMQGDKLVVAFFAACRLPFSAGIAAQMRHSRWEGFTFWDFIAPLFLFVVGLSMPFAFSRRLERGGSRKDLYRHIVRRTLILILLGLVFNGLLDLDFSNFRYAGVLQRIALCYFFAALIVMNSGVRGQALFTAGLLLGYWAAMALIPVPGFGAGVLTPEGNLAGYIDRAWLPGRFCCYKFGDNEGYLSTIPAVSTTLFGVLCGHLLRSSVPQIGKVRALLAGGAASLLLGWLWSLAFPIITMLWTSSYVLWANGWCMLLFGLFYWIIDLRGRRKWAFPFMVIGLNAITIYVVQSQFDFSAVSNIFIRGFVNSVGAYKPLVAAASVVAVEWLLLYFLYRQRIFLKV
ncbi:MAG: DUF5009 domain-containing protein [Acidobacteriota bacterium]